MGTLLARHLPTFTTQHRCWQTEIARQMSDERANEWMNEDHKHFSHQSLQLYFDQSVETPVSLWGVCVCGCVCMRKVSGPCDQTACLSHAWLARSLNVHLSYTQLLQQAEQREGRCWYKVELAPVESLKNWCLLMLTKQNYFFIMYVYSPRLY